MIHTLVLFASILAAWRIPHWAVVGCALLAVVISDALVLTHQSFPTVLLQLVCDLTLTWLLIYWTVRIRRDLDQAHRAARIDMLTGLPNRRAILESLEAELCRQRRFKRALTLAMLDCDGFKIINDQQGHLAGDRALKQIADALREHTRGYDCVGRLGGDEFVLILSEVIPGNVQEIIDRLRNSLRQQLEREYPLLSFSAGAVTIDGGSEPQQWDSTEYLRRADQALYQAKRQGRDQTCFVNAGEA